TELAGVLPRAATDVEAAVARVRPICEDVKRRGAAAVREYTARFDGVDLATTRVPPQALDAALAGLDPDVRAALEEAARPPAGARPGRPARPGPRGPPRGRAFRPGPRGGRVRPRRPGRLSLLGRDEPRPGPGRGRDLDRGSIPAPGR